MMIEIKNTLFDGRQQEKIFKAFDKLWKVLGELDKDFEIVFTDCAFQHFNIDFKDFKKGTGSHALALFMFEMLRANTVIEVNTKTWKVKQINRKKKSS